ncbi:hydrogenobyrinic acid a,c-diamide synthase (glutamine-hydrolyzing) [bacterium]|nr:hydrogenobyrinic acid a,c-diamide synthase (glutamine-hydrolyzing) [bacterium]MBU2461377.1 hydrogenobyrinic acid a,c-diamide synthase (glutamine-hydrolyzing) [bacterium]
MAVFNIPRILISAPNRSSGKTTLSIGLSRALSNKGFSVQTFKKGPDFIDPMWLSTASSKDCHNLDLFMMEKKAIISSFYAETREADIALIEGNMGLYDGFDLEGEGSTSNLARILKSPIILIIDATRMTRGIAPLLLGYLRFESDVNIAGVILNKVSGARHERKLREAIGHYCGIEVLGALPNLPEIEIQQRHLGLVPVAEEERTLELISKISEKVADSVDVARILEIANSALPLSILERAERVTQEEKIKIGVARDTAFCFYYPQNLTSLKRAGAELIFFDTLKDCLPDVDGLYIGGGFPEVFMDGLEENVSLRKQIKKAVCSGMPVYAECGGLIYLSRSIQWKGQKREMIGAIPADIEIREKPRGHGYVVLKEKNGRFIKGHEFHYSEVVNLGNVDFAYQVLRGQGIDGIHDGIVHKNILASYTHIHSLSTPDWAEGLVSFIKGKW